MAIESKNLLVWVKAMSRSSNLPLDASEIYDSLSSAQTYIESPIAYAGQTIKALVEGRYHTYTIQPSDAGYVLEEVGSSSSNSKQYVQILDVLPESGQEEGILYICGSTGYIWTGTVWKTVFEDISSEVTEMVDRIDAIETAMDSKASLENPIFTGIVSVNGEELATKSYADGLVANITSCAPGIVGIDNPLPTSDYKAGQTFRVIDSGTYGGHNCEPGDLIIVISDYVADTASSSDFMCLQANIDGAITSSADVSTVGEIVIFDAVTGKVIKGSGINISSINDVIAKSHEHTNKSILDTYDKTQTELLEASATTAQSKIDAYKLTVDAALENKADISDIPNTYTQTEIDNLLTPITENLNTKVDATTVDTKISTATESITAAYTTAISEKIGAIPSGTSVKEYVDNSIGAGGTDQAEAIATAKSEAIAASKEYTDAALTIVEF